MADSVSMSALVFLVVIVLAGIGAHTAAHRFAAWLEERRRHECAYHEQIEAIREAIGLKPDTPAWMIGADAVKIIREPILSLATDPYPANAVDTIAITSAVQMVWGKCPVCSASHGVACRPSVGMAGNSSGVAHYGRLKNAPEKLRLEWIGIIRPGVDASGSPAVD